MTRQQHSLTVQFSEAYDGLVLLFIIDMAAYGLLGWSVWYDLLEFGPDEMQVVWTVFGAMAAWQLLTVVSRD